MGPTAVQTQNPRSDDRQMRSCHPGIRAIGGCALPRKMTELSDDSLERQEEIDNVFRRRGSRRRNNAVRLTDSAARLGPVSLAHHILLSVYIKALVALDEVGKQPRFVELHCKFADVAKMAVRLRLGVAGAAL